MPLVQGSSPEAISENISTERHAGKPEKQAVAIAENVARQNKDRGGITFREVPSIACAPRSNADAAIPVNTRQASTDSACPEWRPPASK